MASTNLLNVNLSSLSGGVTEQYQEGRFDSQVSSMINCIPSITRGVLRRNPINTVDLLVAPVTALPSDLSDCFVYSYDRGTGIEQYIVVVPGDGFLHVFNANDGTHLYTNSTINSYLQAGVGNRAKESFNALTIGDHTFLVNRNIVTTFTSAVASSAGYSDMAFYWIKKTTSVVIEQEQVGTGTVVSGSLLRGYDYTLNGYTVESTEDSRPSTSPKIELNTATLIATEFVTQVATSEATKSEKSVAYNNTFAGTDWVWEDSFGDEASIGVWKTIDSSDKLPVNLPSDLDTFIVKVSGGTSSEFDDYYLQYVYADRNWKEVPSPGKLTTLDSTTMPHVLYRMGDGGFFFDAYRGVEDGDDSTSGPTGASKWGQRKSGGDDPLDDPSFVGKSITNIFFHKNRLGLITDDTVVLSSTSEYGIFFPSTIQDVLDDDPIDLAVASTDVTILRHAVPTAGQLILFADDTQFSLSSTGGALTPNSAEITALSNYTYGNQAQATSIGNKVFFSNQAGGYSQIYAYRITDEGSKLTEAIPMTIHLPTYISSSISRIVGHDVLGYTFIEEENNPKQLTALTTVVRGTEELQNAFHRWEFTKDIVSTHIINNDLYILFSDGDLVNMSLEIPSSIDDVTYLDSYDSDANTVYESSILFSEFFIRDGEGKGTVRGRYQIRTMQYTITDNSKYITNIFNTDHSILDPLTMMGTTWVDTDVWDDSLIWIDVDPLYTREYIDDDKVTIMSNSKKTRITFKSSEDEPSKGFELATVNVEGFFHQRSRRY